MKTVWVLVAEESNAKILEWASDDLLVEVRQIVARMPVDQVDDIELPKRRGRPSTARAAQKEKAPSGDLERHHTAQAFAERVASVLEDYRDAGRFDELYVVAGPRMAGYLRPEMAPAVKSVTLRTIDAGAEGETEESLTRRLSESESE